MEKFLIRNTQTGEMLGLVPTKREAAVCIGDMDAELPLGLFRVTDGENMTLSLGQTYISTAS